MRRKQVSGAALASTSQLEEPQLFIEEFDHETCRLCSLKSNGCFGIFSARGVKKKLPDLVKIYLNFEICESDSVTKKICKKCCDLILKFHEFVLFAQSVQENLFQLTTIKSEDLSIENIELENGITDAEFLLINKCETLGGPNFGSSQNQYLSNHHSLKAPVDILPELPLVLDADFEDPEELSKLKDGANLDEIDNEELLQQNELEFDQESTTSEEEDDEPSDARKTRKNTDFRDQENELCEFYQLVCSECNSKWTSFSTLSSHCKQTHNCRPNVSCHCGKSFNRRSHLIRHRNQHLGFHRYKCNICSRGFHFKFMLRSHMFTHGPESDKPYKCEICQRAYITKSGLTNHNIMKHLPPRARVTCDICNNTFSHPNCLYTHKKTVHADQRSFVCDICGKTMSTLGNLKGHLETHKEASNVQCEVCGKRFKTRMRLVRHMEYHKAVIHECHVCGKQYQTRGSLRSHLLVHSEDRPHKCNLCQKTFKRSKQLKLHLYQHTGERPYKCPYCPKTFTNAGNRATHKRRIHSKLAAQDCSGAAADDTVNNLSSVPLTLFAPIQQGDEVDHQQSVHSIPQLQSVVLHPQTMLMNGMVLQHGHPGMTQLLQTQPHMQHTVSTHSYNNLC